MGLISLTAYAALCQLTVVLLFFKILYSWIWKRIIIFI